MKTGWVRCVLAAVSVFAVCVGCPLRLAAQGDAGHGVTGEWQGMIGTLHVLLDVESTSGGGWSAKLTVPDQGNVTLQADAVTFAAGSLHSEWKTIGASYEAELSASGDALSGTWQQQAASLPLTMRRPGARAVGFTLKARTIGRVPMTPCKTVDGNTEGLCGTVSVAENRELRSGRQLALKVMVLPALADRPAADAFLPLAGGPGQSAVEIFPMIGVTNAVRKERDVVLVDQRGTGGSAPLLCDLRNPASLQQTIGEDLPVERLRTCREKLGATADLTQYTTSIFADDLDEVRAALGYDKVDVYGMSYGTQAALVYLRRHGDHVRTIALDGVAPPSYRIPLDFSPALQGSIDLLMAKCEADAACHEAFPELRKEFLEVLSRLEKTPATVEVGKQTVTISRGIFVSDLRPVMYLPQAVPQIPYIVHQAFRGNWAMYAGVAAQVRGLIDKQINRALALSVACAEDVPGTTPAMVARVTGGTYLGDFQVRQYQSACREWPQGKAPADFHTAVVSDVPALLVSGALDPATPPAVAREVASHLSRSQMVVLKEGTHGTGSACVDGVVARFVATAGPVDASCVEGMTMGPFLTHVP